MNRRLPWIAIFKTFVLWVLATMIVIVIHVVADTPAWADVVLSLDGGCGSVVIGVLLWDPFASSS